MQPNQNSFRLGRLSHTSDFRKHSTSQYTTNPKDTFKLAAITSITRGIKHNDLSFITGRQLPKLRKQPQQNGDNFEYGAAHDNLTSIRKKHDNVNKQKLQMENKIALLKQQRQKFQIVQNEYQGNRSQGSDKVKSMENQLQNIRLQYQQGQWNKKIYQMLTQRIKNDKVVYDQRKYDSEKELEHLRKQLKIFVKQGTGITEQTDRTSKVYQKLLKQLQSQQAERQSHLSSLQSALNNRHIVNQSNQLRKYETEQIAMKAMQDKNEDEINWIHILQVHKFVHNFLRNKMNRQMDTFYSVQMAFKNIKIATGVHDAQTLIFKFLNKQQVYGQLLSKIAENQRQIIELKAHRDHQLKQRKILKQEKRANQSKKKEQIQFRDDLKQVEQITVKSKSAELKTQNVRTWIIRNMKKISNIDKSQQDTNVARGTQQVATGFKKFIQLLSQQIDKSENVQIKESQPSSNDLNIKNDVRAFRAKPKSKKILNSGEQVQNEFDQEQLPTTQDQQELIANQRQDILKQNQKFMKDLKRKMEEIKKLRIQAQPKKKSATSPQKKAPVPEQ